MAKKATRAGATAIAVKATPSFASGYVRAILERAIDGLGPIRPAAASADARLVRHDGDVEAAVTALIRSHTALAGAEGFVANVGGLVTMAVSIPVNVTGLALIKCHLVASITHLRGYDLTDERVRNAIIACMLGSGTVRAMVRDGRLPSTPMAIATAPAIDPELSEIVAREVTAELIGQVGGRRLAAIVGRRIPLAGGVIGAGGDGFSTYQVGVYAAAELRDRRLA